MHLFFLSSFVGGGWTLYRDPKADDHPYYYNEATRESLWAEEWEGRYGSSAARPPAPPPSEGGGGRQHHEVSFYDLPVHPPGSSDLDVKFQDLLESREGQEQLEREIEHLKGQVERGEKKVRERREGEEKPHGANTRGHLLYRSLSRTR